MLMVFMFSVLLSGIVIAYLDMVAVLSKSTSHKLNRYRTLYIAEAGVNRLAWYLENRAPDATTNGTWRGTISEALSGYTYNSAAVDSPLEGPVISATSSQGANVASRAMDNSLTTYWRSSGGLPQVLTFSLAINGDYTIYLNRVRMEAGSGSTNQFPRNYLWQTSTNGTTWTTVVTKTNNTLYDVTDTFTLRQANYIRLYVSAVQSGNLVNISEVEISGVVVPATASVSSSQGANVAASAVDNNLATYWQSSNAGVLPQTLTLTFPTSSNYSVNKIRMRLGTGVAAAQFPADYTWAVSSDGASWTTVVNKSGNAATDVTDTFTLQSNVNYLRLSVTAVIGAGNQVGSGEIDVPAISLLSSCIVTLPNSRQLSYFLSQDAIVDGTAPPAVSRQPKSFFSIESGQ